MAFFYFLPFNIIIYCTKCIIFYIEACPYFHFVLKASKNNFFFNSAICYWRDKKFSRNNAVQEHLFDYHLKFCIRYIFYKKLAHWKFTWLSLNQWHVLFLRHILFTIKLHVLRFSLIWLGKRVVNMNSSLYKANIFISFKRSVNAWWHSSVIIATD